MKPTLLIAILLLCTSCMAQEPYVKLKGQKFTVEIADTQEKQSLGLMFRDEMADDHGMIFIYPYESMQSFWMKNTRIPLDIFYFDRDLKLVNVAENAKPCRTPRCPSYPSTAPAQYILELNAGKAKELGVGKGDKLELHLE